jgi:hypothetical protein
MASDRATHDFLAWYLNGTMDLYHKAQETFESGLSEARQAVTNPLDYVRRLVVGQPPATAQSPQPPPGRQPQSYGPPAPGDEVEKLRSRVAELEELLAQAGSKAPRPAAPRRSAPKPAVPEPAGTRPAVPKAAAPKIAAHKAAARKRAPRPA